MSAAEKRPFIELQHVNLKLPLRPAEKLDLEWLIPIFYRWIRDQIRDELLINVADYRHVARGPGVVLIGHEADYSLDESDGRVGLRYNRKAPVSGSNQHRLEQAARSALEAVDLLQREPEFGAKLDFQGEQIEVYINDRLLAPNNPETRQVTEADFRLFFDRLLGPGEYSLKYPEDRRKLFGVYAHARRSHTTAELLKNLGGSTGFLVPEPTGGIARS